MIGQPQPESDGPGEWDAMLSELRSRHPGASDGILFCVFKLQQNPNASLRDFREEARLHGLSVSGRSLHSAKVLLGMAEAAAPRSRGAGKAPAPPPRRAGEDHDADDATGHSLEDRVIDAVRKIQESATSQSQRLRKAMQEAIEILQRALNE